MRIYLCLIKWMQSECRYIDQNFSLSLSLLLCLSLSLSVSLSLSLSLCLSLLHTHAGINNNSSHFFSAISHRQVWVHSAFTRSKKIKYKLPYWQCPVFQLWQTYTCAHTKALTRWWCCCHGLICLLSGNVLCKNWDGTESLRPSWYPSTPPTPPSTAPWVVSVEDLDHVLRPIVLLGKSPFCYPPCKTRHDMLTITVNKFSYFWMAQHFWMEPEICFKNENTHTWSSSKHRVGDDKDDGQSKVKPNRHMPQTQSKVMCNGKMETVKFC